MSAVLLLLAACSSSGDDQDAEIRSQVSAAVSSILTPEAPDCVDVLQEGEVIPTDIIDTGCYSDPETLEGFSWFDCDDGRRLIETDAGGEELYGFVGDVAIAPTTPDVAADPAYADAVNECRP